MSSFWGALHLTNKPFVKVQKVEAAHETLMLDYPSLQSSAGDGRRQDDAHRRYVVTEFVMALEYPNEDHPFIQNTRGFARKIQSSEKFVLQANNRCLCQVPGNERRARI